MKTRVEVDGVGLIAEGAMVPYLELGQSDVDEMAKSWKRPTVVLDVAPWCGYGVQAADKYRRVYCDSTSGWTSWQRNEERRTSRRSGSVRRTIRSGRLADLFDRDMEERCAAYFRWADIDAMERSMFRAACADDAALAIVLADDAGSTLTESLLVRVERLAEWYLVFTHWKRGEAEARRKMLGVRALFEAARIVCDDLHSRLNLGPAMTYKSAVATSAAPALGIVLCDDDDAGEWTDYVPRQRWNQCQ